MAVMVRSSLGTVYDDSAFWAGMVNYQESQQPYVDGPVYSITVTAPYPREESSGGPGATAAATTTGGSGAAADWRGDWSAAVRVPQPRRQQSGSGIPLPLVAAVALGLFLGLRN